MITIIDLNSSETEHIVELLKNLGESFRISSDEMKIINSDKVILCSSDDIPAAVRNLHLLNLYTILRICRRPLLGIGSGMHLMGGNFNSGKLSGLGIFQTEVHDFLAAEQDPGFHKIKIVRPGILLAGITNEQEFYFLNSHYFGISDLTAAETEAYNIRLSAAVELVNYFGVQFCPGRSGAAGQKVMENFISAAF